MAQAIPKLFSNALLLFTSCLGLKVTSRGLKYARAAFKLYFLTGTVAVISCLLDCLALQDLDEVAWVWCYCLSLPLLTTDLCGISPYMPDITPFHLVIPMYTVIAYHVNPSQIDALLLSISHSVSVLFLAMNVAWDGHCSGIALSFLQFFSLFRMDTGEKARTNWAIINSLSNIFAIKVIGIYY